MRKIPSYVHYIESLIGLKKCVRLSSMIEYCFPEYDPLDVIVRIRILTIGRTYRDLKIMT